MKRRNFRKNEKPLVMIIPMIDIMLFLLVFFMLSTIYMVQTNNFNVNLPQSEGEKHETKPNITSITVAEDGEIFFEDGKILRKQLPELIHKKLTEDSEAIFVLMGDKSAKYEQVVSVLEILKRSGVRHVSIATELKN